MGKNGPKRETACCLLALPRRRRPKSSMQALIGQPLSRCPCLSLFGFHSTVWRLSFSSSFYVLSSLFHMQNHTLEHQMQKISAAPSEDFVNFSHDNFSKKRDKNNFINDRYLCMPSIYLPGLFQHSASLGRSGQAKSNSVRRVFSWLDPCPLATTESRRGGQCRGARPKSRKQKEKTRKPEYAKVHFVLHMLPHVCSLCTAECFDA